MKCSFQNCILFISFHLFFVDSANHNCIFITINFPGTELGAGDDWEWCPEPCFPRAAVGLRISDSGDSESDPPVLGMR